MPNWCTNTLTITGPSSLVSQWAQTMQGSSVSWPDAGDADVVPAVLPLCFHRGVPIPADIVRQGFSPAGYDWCRRHWGTKWEPREFAENVPEVSVQPDGSATAFYRFDTAWSPPLAWLHTVAAHWPALTFALEYEEPDNAVSGDALWRDGQCVRRMAF
ncbi:hypothetical protein [Sulfobacillus sp. hq2]|uniref:DUF1281 family ferredoxin-like fold protein n=1 Tax=Sulfobacillus sp. hq2 TaxID=2039167 RepID=UPI000CD2AFF5|nr:hypothetical protein [Sulfobacillus sp. hq2]POB12181.1 hypothetical protein CO251_00715 [Sulfobacillus sp. hq2]